MQIKVGETAVIQLRDTDDNAEEIVQRRKLQFSAPESMGWNCLNKKT